MVKGFLGAAVKAGIKYSDRLDLGLIYSESRAAVAATFTSNVFKAAPVTDAIQTLKNNRYIRAILVNSGNANACTGLMGIKNVKKCLGALAEKLGVRNDDILMSSTGVIGIELPVDKIINKLSDLKNSLSFNGLSDVSRAIMTTDTIEKTVEKKILIDGKEINIFGMAKGSGMIAPKLISPFPSATMLSFIMTDANIDCEFLQRHVSLLCNDTFNRITVDGDTSTNDSVIVMANAMAENNIIADMQRGKEFINALRSVMEELSQKIVKDGEGATKFVHISIKGMDSHNNASLIARTIAESPLVKTAIFGEDPNWGRILAAAGRAGVAFNPEMVSLMFDDVMIVRRGTGIPENESLAKYVMKNKAYTITVVFEAGDFYADFYTCDYSLDYIKINANYRS